MPKIRVELSNQKGLHARASAKFVKCASGFVSDIRVIKDETVVDARSIMGLLMLGIGIGHYFDIVASGVDEDAALHALSQLVNDRFGEEE